ncbi:MAG: hypothetical protein M1833_006951 [Piccolia ochrophora]|nr:MAG: hypothetical protein M1833_006951 [Piccolia ochrophora]
MAAQSSPVTRPPSSKEHVAETLLRSVHPPHTAANLFLTKVVQRPLPLLPTSNTAATDARSARRAARFAKDAARRKRRPQPLSARQKRQLGLYDLPARVSPSEVKAFEGLNHMWGGYIREVLEGAGTAQGKAQRLCSADMHGARVVVVRSRCVERVGVEGVVVREGRGVFIVVGEGGSVKTLPKEHTVFKVEVPPEEEPEGQENARHGEEKEKVAFEIHGEQFKTRPTDRANKKFKARNLPDL